MPRRRTSAVSTVLRRGLVAAALTLLGGMAAACSDVGEFADGGPGEEAADAGGEGGELEAGDGAAGADADGTGSAGGDAGATGTDGTTGDETTTTPDADTTTPDGSVDPSAETGSTSTASTVLVVPTTGVGAATVSSTTIGDGVVPPAGAAPALGLGPDGLVLIESGSGSTNPVSYGSPESQVLASLSSAIGTPDSVAAGSCANGQARVARWDGELQVDFGADGGLLSWRLLPGSDLTDLTGIGLGSTYDELTSTWVVAVEETSLGYQFATEGGGGNGLGGVLDGPDPDNRVTELWGGQVCAGG